MQFKGCGKSCRCGTYQYVQYQRIYGYREVGALFRAFRSASVYGARSPRAIFTGYSPENPCPVMPQAVSSYSPRVHSAPQNYSGVLCCPDSSLTAGSLCPCSYCLPVHLKPIARSRSPAELLCCVPYFACWCWGLLRAASSPSRVDKSFTTALSCRRSGHPAKHLRSHSRHRHI